MSINEKDIEKWRNEIVKLKEEVKDRITHGLNGDPNTAIKVFCIEWRVKAICYHNKENHSADLDIIAQEFNFSRRKLDYLCEIGEWLLLDRDTRKLPAMEYHTFWSNEENIPFGRGERDMERIDEEYASILDFNGFDY